jgi:hypothetical protein
VFYAREVVPLLDGNGFGASSFKTAAAAINGKARSNDRTYGGSWNGPNNGRDIWSTKNRLLSQQVEVSANAAIWPVAALTFK